MGGLAYYSAGISSTGIHTLLPYYLLSHSQARLLSFFGKPCPGLVAVNSHQLTYIRVQHIGGSYTSMGRGMRDLPRTRPCMTNRNVKGPSLSRCCRHFFSWHPKFIYGKWRNCGRIESFFRVSGRASWISC